MREATSEIAPLENRRVQVQSNRSTLAFFTDGQVPATFAVMDPGASETHNVVVHAYYVKSLGPNAAGVAQYALYRRSLTAGPSIIDEEVIPGVEDLQVQFGIDAAPLDGSTDRYVNPDAVPAGARIVTTRLAPVRSRSSASISG